MSRIPCLQPIRRAAVSNIVCRFTLDYHTPHTRIFLNRAVSQKAAGPFCETTEVRGLAKSPAFCERAAATSTETDTRILRRVRLDFHRIDSDSRASDRACVTQSAASGFSELFTSLRENESLFFFSLFFPTPRESSSSPLDRVARRLDCPRSLSLSLSPRDLAISQAGRWWCSRRRRCRRRRRCSSRRVWHETIRRKEEIHPRRR